MDLSLQVGRYDIRKLLGRGATGTVYLAKDTFTGSEVALKTIEPEVFNDPEFGTVYRQQFLNEASLAGKLRHPHIVAILDAVVQEDSGHIAMELVTGGDLSAHVAPGKLLPVDRAELGIVKNFRFDGLEGDLVAGKGVLREVDRARSAPAEQLADVVATDLQAQVHVRSRWIYRLLPKLHIAQDLPC